LCLNYTLTEGIIFFGTQKLIDYALEFFKITDIWINQLFLTTVE